MVRRSEPTSPPILSAARRSRITGTHLYQLMRCDRAVWLAWFGNPEWQLEPSEPFRLLLERGREFEASVVAGLGWPEPGYPRGDFEEGARRTWELLAAGVQGVVQGVLVDDDLLGIPDLLRREPGASRLGDFHYVVGDIKSSRHARGDQVMQVAFYSEILAVLQGRVPEYGYLVLRDGHEERFRLADVRHRLQEAIDEIRELLAGPAPGLFVRHECGKCSWQQLCGAQAERGDDVARLPGVTAQLHHDLLGMGVRTVTQLLALPGERIASIPGLLRPWAAAFSARNGKAHLLKRPVLPRGPHVFLRLQRDAFLDRTLAFGVLASDGSYQDFTAADAAGEERARAALVHQLWRQDGTTIFHYGGAPARHLLGPSLPPLEHRLVDLLPVLRGAAVFPGGELDLRGLGRFFKGFEDLTDEPEGLSAVWFDRLLATGEPEWAARIRHCNERELRLLRALHSWLVEQR